MIDAHIEPVVSERALLPPLVEWLRRRRRIRDDTVLVTELPWFGRRVDLASMTRSGITTAFELKLRDNGRALEQATFNTLSFDRSYVVTATMPKNGLLGHAAEVGVGVIVVSHGKVTLLLEAKLSPRELILRPRLLERLKRAHV